MSFVFKSRLPLAIEERQQRRYWTALLAELPPPVIKPSVADCLSAIAARYGMDENVLLLQTRRPSVSHKRHEVFWLARVKFGISLPEIAAFFEMDHTSVLHGVRRVQAELEKFKQGGN